MFFMSFLPVLAKDGCGSLTLAGHLIFSKQVYRFRDICFALRLFRYFFKKLDLRHFTVYNSE